MPITLYNDIQAFLEHRNLPTTHRTLSTTYDFSLPCSPPPVAPGWTHGHTHTTTNCPLFSTTDQFLPYCTMGKGERSIHFLFYQYLCKNPRYYIISEFSDINSFGRQAVDLLIIERTTGIPLAIIELKHYSVHQTHAPKKLQPLFDGLDKDHEDKYLKSKSITLSGIAYIVPLIQIGLITAVYRYISPVPGPHPVSFIRKYINSIDRGMLSAPASTNAISNYDNAMLYAYNWYTRVSPRYTRGHGGWGPVECYTLPGVPDPIVGRVSYVCVMTPIRKITFTPQCPPE
jgi:hypothetical protein